MKNQKTNAETASSFRGGASRHSCSLLSSARVAGALPQWVKQ